MDLNDFFQEARDNKITSFGLEINSWGDGGISATISPTYEHGRSLDIVINDHSIRVVGNGKWQKSEAEQAAAEAAEGIETARVAAAANRKQPKNNQADEARLSVIQFLHGNCDGGSDKTVKVADLFAAYKAWAVPDAPALELKAFTDALFKINGITKSGKGADQLCVGASLKPAQDKTANGTADNGSGNDGGSTDLSNKGDQTMKPDTETQEGTTGTDEQKSEADTNKTETDAGGEDDASEDEGDDEEDPE